MPTSDQRASWRAHPAAHGGAAMLLAIHDQFRAASLALVDRVATGVPDVSVLARAFIPLATTLHHHHHAEEVMLFPLVHRRTGTRPEQLQRDHDEMTAAITAVETCLRAGGEGARTVIARFHEILMTHLDREEELAVPVLLETPPHELWGDRE